MQSKLINLLEIIDDVGCEDKDQTKNLFCSCKAHIG